MDNEEQRPVNPISAIARQVRRARANPDDSDSKDVLTIIAAYWDAMGEGAFVVGAPHSEIADCPTYYDGCNCTIDTLNAQIEYTKELLAKLEARGAASETPE